MDERKTLDTTAYAAMLFMCMAMGLQSISIKIIGSQMSPMMQIGLRSGLAVILVIVYMRWCRENFALLGQIWLPGLLAGLFFAIEYVFIGEALRLTTAARVTVFMYTAPLFSALMLHFCKQSERLSFWQWVGVGITFGGVVAAFWEFSPSESGQAYPHMLFGDLLALMGGLSWALTTLVLRLSRLQSTSGTMTLFYQLILTAIILPISALVLGQGEMNFSSFVIFNLTYQTLFVAFGCMLAWLWLLRTYSATRIGILSFLTPLFTLVFSILLLDEPVAPAFIIGAILVVGGLIVISLSKNTSPQPKKYLKSWSKTGKRGKNLV